MSTQEATLIAASLAVLAAVASAIITFWNGARSRRRDALSEIAAHRVIWIETLRSEIAELMTVCLELSGNQEKKEKGLSALHLYSRIVLKLNPPEHGEFMTLLADMRNAAIEEDTSPDEPSSTLKLYNQVHGMARPIIKGEWEKAKAEIMGKQPA